MFSVKQERAVQGRLALRSSIIFEWLQNGFRLLNFSVDNWLKDTNVSVLLWGATIPNSARLSISSANCLPFHQRFFRSEVQTGFSELYQGAGNCWYVNIYKKMLSLKPDHFQPSKFLLLPSITLTILFPKETEAFGLYTEHTVLNWLEVRI